MVLFKVAALFDYGRAVDRGKTGDDYAQRFAASMGVDGDYAFIVRRWLPVPLWGKKISSQRRLVIWDGLTHVVGHFE